MISYISLIFYIIAFTHIMCFLLWGNRKLRNAFNIIMAIGLLFSIINVIIRYTNTGIAPTSTLYDIMNLLIISFGITYFILYAKYKRPLLGLFISPFMVIATIISIIFPPNVIPSYQVVDSVWRYVHLPFIVLGTTFLIAAFITSIMYLIQESQLKKKNFGFIFQRFPALDTIASINNTSLQIGFYFFTIGVMLGFAWMLQNNLEEILLSMKIIFSVLTLFVFAILMILKRKSTTTPKQTAQWTVIGFVLILVTYIGVANFMLR